MKWYIGNIAIKNQVVMAPMAGVSNPTYMKILENMGVGLAFTELISSEALVRNNEKTLEMLRGLEKMKIPVGVQLFGANPEVMAKAAQIVTKLYPNVFIDINMGCPVPKIAIKSGGGSALLKDPAKIGEIVTRVVEAVDVPVTVKIRSGWDASSINAVEVAKIIQKSGAKAISVHARTRAQGYSGESDWNIIKQVVASVDIPVIGNGDILTCYDAKKMLDETKCAAVMIGRGLMGNPWLVRDCVNYLDKKLPPLKVTLDEKINMIAAHLQALVKDVGEKQAVLQMRGHILNYLRGLPENKEVKRAICASNSKAEILEVLENYRIILKKI